MRKSTKGAVAASLAAVLLLGAWGTQATWSDDQQVPGTTLGTGHLKLVNAHCDGWLLKVDLDDPSPIQFNPALLKLAPGDLLTQTCTFEVDVAGVNVKAKLATSTPQKTGAADLTSALDVVAKYKDDDGAQIGATTILNDGDVITADLVVSLPTTVTNVTQGLTATLDDITVTATQA